MNPIDRARGLLRGAARPAALTGAGVSAESGVPTFRGAGGLWRSFRPEALATPEAFQRDPRLVWEFYNWRREVLKPLQPNPAHAALAAFERDRPAFRLITQNVDDLHRLAGSRGVLELHGSIWRTRCTRCGALAENRDVPIRVPPACGTCSGLLRPDVVWFGEPVPLMDEAAAIARACDVFLVAGTASAVYPAAGLVEIAKEAGAPVIEVNPEDTAISAWVDISLRAKAGEALPVILSAG